MAQLAIGCGDYPDVHLARLRPSHAQHLAVLEDSQHLGLEVRACFADLVEKQRAARGALEASRAVPDSAGERSLFMAEQLALDHAIGQRLTIDCEKRTVRPIAPVVKHPRDQLFARASLAFDKCRRA